LQDLVDAAHHGDGPAAVGRRQKGDRAVAEHLAVDEEVERDDQGQDHLQADRAHLAGEVGRIAG